MDITLLPPSTILSRHSHLALLPSPFPNTLEAAHYPTQGARFKTEHGSYPRVPYKPRRRYEAGPMADGSSPILNLPDEIILSIFTHLDWDELVSLRPVCKQWSHLALTPALHTSLNLPSIPHPLPSVLEHHLLKSVRHLSLHLFPYPTQRAGSLSTAALSTLLEAVPPHQLRSLSLPFSAPYVPGADLGVALRRIGSELQYLDLKGSGLIGSRWTSWLAEIGKNGPGLSHLDLGFTSISSLPTPTGDSLDPFRNLQTLRIASCSYLPKAVLAEFLAELPPTIEMLDLSRLDQVSFQALWDMRVVHDDKPTGLKEIKVVGIDHLTRKDVRRLKAHWEEQRRACFLPVSHPAPILILPSKWSFQTPPMGPAPLSPPRSPPRRDLLTRVLSPSPPVPSHSFIPVGNNSQHRPPTPPRSVSPDSTLRSLQQARDGVCLNVVHSAILESEDEEGYRQFIGEVANATVPIGLGLGIHLGPERQSRARWVEVDGGGLM
ncbi:hypothetical protein DB88DRAFT_482371 [Papiliotrema laurentii]|uniref:F-box domain-containing protein n=1 Tax=Papiliotrema laurentii TaxID=5418 RepID=A0AAD9L7X3_PAPLA|nr:hypothetical protein DB88DRAFT_482371 [Papiliotrema laurentii]